MLVKGLDIAAGIPKICIPVMGNTKEEILSKVDELKNADYDLIEVRIDFFSSIKNNKDVIDVLKEIRQRIDKPILCTYRSSKEGGQIQLSDEEYYSLIEAVCNSQSVDIVDVELNSGNSLVYRLVELIHQHDMYVIMSHHDFDGTPKKEDMMDTLEKMEVMNADILKIAYMPLNKKDVVSLMEVTMLMSEKLNKPLVTMSMGKLGLITRLSGELTGSAITFASHGKASAPGQINASDVKRLLECIHD